MSKGVVRSRGGRWSVSALSVGAAAVAFVAGACVQRAADSGGEEAGRSALTGEARAQSRTGLNELARLSSTFAGISARVTPAVVNVESQTIVPGRELRDPFSEFFGGEFGGRRFREPDRRSQSLGSGVIIDARGLIITNSHVIANATQINVTLSDRRRFPARLLGSDPASDVAVLRIEGARDLPALRWGDSEALNVGDIVLAIGSPFNLASTVTQGIVSAKGRADVGVSAFEDFLQTDAAINPGNSGGALVDVNGDLVGINTAILSGSGGNQGIGLAIPSNLARSIGEQLATTGRVTRGWLGVVGVPLTADVATELGLGRQGGIVVRGIYPNSPAASVPWSGGGDIILSANGVEIDTPGQLRNAVAALSPGDPLRLRVWSNGQIRDYDLRVAARPARVQGV